MSFVSSWPTSKDSKGRWLVNIVIGIPPAARPLVGMNIGEKRKERKGREESTQRWKV
jgi:hypothetical protein